MSRSFIWLYINVVSTNNDFNNSSISAENDDKTSNYAKKRN